MKNSCSNAVGSLVIGIKVLCLNLDSPRIMSFIRENVMAKDNYFGVIRIDILGHVPTCDPVAVHSLSHVQLFATP